MKKKGMNKRIALLTIALSSIMMVAGCSNNKEQASNMQVEAQTAEDNAEEITNETAEEIMEDSSEMNEPIVGGWSVAENNEIKVLEEKTEETEKTVETKVQDLVASKSAKEEFAGMSERDLIVALLKEQKKASRHSLITAASLVAICLIIGAAVLIIVPRVNATLNNAYQAIDSIENVVANADKAISSVEKSLDGIDEMVKNVDKVVVDNTDAVGKTVDKMSSIDFATLNKSIKDLSDIIEPLAKFFKR